MAVPWEQSLLAQHVWLLYTSSEWVPPSDFELLSGRYLFFTVLGTGVPRESEQGLCCSVTAVAKPWLSESQGWPWKRRVMLTGVRSMSCSLLWVSAKLRRKKFLCKSSMFEQVLRRKLKCLAGKPFLFFRMRVDHQVHLRCRAGPGWRG